MANPKGNQTLLISTTTECRESIDQIKCCCITLQCETVRWYKKVGIYIIEILLSNAYYMYAKNTTKPMAKNIKDFGESTVTNLIGPPPNHHLKLQASFHHLSTIPPIEKKKNTARAFKQCYKNQKRWETRYECGFCPNKPALCVNPCFCLFLQNLGVFQEETSSSTEDK